MSRFTAPRLHATDRSVRRTWSGAWGLRVYPLSLFRPRHCAGGNARNQNAVVLARRSPSAIVCNHDGLQEPVMANVSITDFLTKFIRRGILRVRMHESSVVATLEANCDVKHNTWQARVLVRRSFAPRPAARRHSMPEPSSVGPPMSVRRCAAARQVQHPSHWAVARKTWFFRRMGASVSIRFIC